MRETRLPSKWRWSVWPSIQGNMPLLFPIVCLTGAVWGTGTSALAFTSGSTGALGAFAPVSNTTVVLPPDGILNYTTVTIPSGVTVTFQPNSANTPVTLLAQGNITIGGQLYVNGANGLAATPAGSAVQLGGLGGPGGYRGGQGGQKGLANNSGAPGQGPNAGTSGRFDAVVTANGTYGADTSFVSLIPLFGGSGGGGGTGDATLWGTSGGGGGGALVLASSTQITVQTTGTVAANGGNGPIYTTVCSTYSGGPGSGGGNTHRRASGHGPGWGGGDRRGWRLCGRRRRARAYSYRMHDLFTDHDQSCCLNFQCAWPCGASQYSASDQCSNVDDQHDRWPLRAGEPEWHLYVGRRDVADRNRESRACDVDREQSPDWHGV
jgi:hypothetical protein